jgi:hypothetical protein
MAKTKKEEKFDCPDCGKVDYVWVNGDAYADRLLEGVKFKVEKIKGKVKVSHKSGDDAYLSSLNTKKFEKAIKASVEANEGSVECSKCGEVWDLEDEDMSGTGALSVPITNMNDVLNKITPKIQSVKTKAVKEKALPKGTREATPEEKLKWWQDEETKTVASLLKRAKGKYGLGRSESSLFTALSKDSLDIALRKYTNKTIEKADLFTALTENSDLDLFEAIQFAVKWDDLQKRKPA